MEANKEFEKILLKYKKVSYKRTGGYGLAFDEYDVEQAMKEVYNLAIEKAAVSAQVEPIAESWSSGTYYDFRVNEDSILKLKLN